jgi:hypothetical protein
MEWKKRSFHSFYSVEFLMEIELEVESLKCETNWNFIECDFE